jgi:hypothetical protein
VRTSAAIAAFTTKHQDSNPKAIVKKTLLNFIAILLFKIMPVTGVVKILIKFQHPALYSVETSFRLIDFFETGARVTSTCRQSVQLRIIKSPGEFIWVVVVFVWF